MKPNMHCAINNSSLTAFKHFMGFKLMWEYYSVFSLIFIPILK